MPAVADITGIRYRFAIDIATALGYYSRPPLYIRAYNAMPGAPTMGGFLLLNSRYYINQTTMNRDAISTTDRIIVATATSRTGRK